MTIHRQTPYHVLAKPIGPLCNMDCTYCFYLEKERLYPQARSWRMSDEVLERFIRQYIRSQPGSTVSFAWQGGEPTLLGMDFFERVVGLQRRYAGDRRIENGFQTNGLLLDDHWGEFLAENRFLVGLSIDGPAKLHDRFRVDRGGHPTFEKVMQGLSYLNKHGVEFNTLTVVQRDNSQHPLEVYRFLKEIGSRFLQFIPVVERPGAAGGPLAMRPSPVDGGEVESVTGWSVEPAPYGEFLCTIFDEWVRRDVGRVFVQLFDVALEAWMGIRPGLCVFRETCGTALAIEHNGDVYSCDHFVYPQNRLGNILQSSLTALVVSPAQKAFGEAKRDALPQYCLQCPVRFACQGECPKNRFARTPQGEAGLNYLCSGYRRFFEHVDPYMVFMASELKASRPPANVMRWSGPAAGGRLRRDHPGLNSLCHCGSGRKLERCCGT